MLNRLFHNGIGFAWGVRAAGFMTLGLLSIANLTLRTRLPNARQRRKAATPEKAVSAAKIRDILTDVPYLFMNVGGFLGLWGAFFPCTFAVYLYSMRNTTLTKLLQFRLLSPVVGHSTRIIDHISILYGTLYET